MHRRRRQRNRGGYSIAALLLLTAAVAVLLGLGASTFRLWRQMEPSVAIANAGAGFLGCGLIGAALGATYQRRARSSLVGMFIGCTTGVVVGLISAVRLNVPIALGGSLLLMIVGAGFWATWREGPENN